MLAPGGEIDRIGERILPNVEGLMAEVFQHTRRVEFHETDIAGILHFVSFFKYMEETEHAFLRSLGTSVLTPTGEGKISFPRVSTSCDFIDTVTFEDVLDVELRIARLGARSVCYMHNFRHEGREIARGEMTSVCCRFVGDQRPRAIEIPAELRALLQPFIDTEAANTEAANTDVANTDVADGP
jgi:4-hydroxybenzoyl-CoA thioesterase/acyl-CoA thioester hydrolase